MVTAKQRQRILSYLRGHFPKAAVADVTARRCFYEIDDQEQVVSMIAASCRGSAY